MKTYGYNHKYLQGCWQHNYLEKPIRVFPQIPWPPKIVSFWLCLWYQAWILSCVTGFKSIQEAVGYHNSLSAVTALVVRCCLESQYCSIQDSPLGHAIDGVSLPLAFTAPHSTMKLATRKEVSDAMWNWFHCVLQRKLCDDINNRVLPFSYGR